MKVLSRLMEIIGWAFAFIWIAGTLDIVDVVISVKPHVERKA